MIIIEARAVLKSQVKITERTSCLCLSRRARLDNQIIWFEENKQQQQLVKEK